MLILNTMIGKCYIKKVFYKISQILGKTPITQFLLNLRIAELQTGGLRRRYSCFHKNFAKFFKTPTLQKLKNVNFCHFSKKRLKAVKLSIAHTCTDCENNCLKIWNFNKWILVRVFSSRAESSVWRP